MNEISNNSLQQSLSSEISANALADRFNATSLEILKLAYDTQLQAMVYHLNYGFKLFSWSTTVQLGMIVFLLTYGSGLNFAKGLLFSSAILVFTIFIFIWQRNNRIEGRDHAESLSFISEKLYLKEKNAFGKGRAVFEKEWHIEECIRRDQFGFNYYNIVLVLFSLMILVTIWLI